MPDEATPTPAPAPAPAPARAPAPAPAPKVVATTMTASKAWGFAKDVLVILIIPLVLWGIKLEVGNAQRDMKLEQLAEQIEDLEEDLDEAQDIDKGVQANALKLVQLEGKLDTANGRLDDIKDLLKNR